MDEADDIRQSLQLVPRRLIDVVGSEQPDDSGGGCPSTEGSRGERRGRRSDFLLDGARLRGAGIDTLGVGHCKVALDGIANSSDADLGLASEHVVNSRRVERLTNSMYQGR